MKQMMRIQPLTEEQKWIVHKFFETWDKQWATESQIRLWYWRMKAHWTRIDKAEEEISKLLKRKSESYRRFKEQEINQHMKEYKQETWWDILRYELIKVNERTLWKSIVIWWIWHYDAEKDKQKRNHVIEIEERRNPEYFQEIIKRFNLLIVE